MAIKRMNMAIPSTSSHVGAMIRRRRSELRITQTALAKQLGVSQDLLSNYEAGKTPIRADDIPALCDALYTKPVYFFPRYEVTAEEEKFLPTLEQFSDVLRFVPTFGGLEDEDESKRRLLELLELLTPIRRTTAFWLVRALVEQELSERLMTDAWPPRRDRGYRAAEGNGPEPPTDDGGRTDSG